MSWWLLAILYGLAGFGYIIVATYLPLMAKDAGSPLLTAHLWTLVGLSIVPGCFGWLWAAKRWGALPCLTANLLVQAISVLLTLASDSPLLLIISSIGFGSTFMGTTSLVMTIARQLSVPGNLNLLGFVTLIYGIGQILGPALTRDRMADFPYDSLVAVIYHGRPGTPMPGWKSMISEADAHWIARQLQTGFPLEADKTAP